MTRWLIRVLVILAGPAIGWFQISETTTGILVGVGCSLLVIILEMVIERISADRSKRRGCQVGRTCQRVRGQSDDHRF